MPNRERAQERLDAAAQEFERGNLVAAKRYCRLVLRLGEPDQQEEALCNLGFLSAGGDEKINYYTQAAENCHSAYACNMLGICLTRKGTRSAIEKAKIWFRKAADGGCPEGFYNLAMMEKDEEKKRSYLSTAWERFSFEPARQLLAQMEESVEKTREIKPENDVTSSNGIQKNNDSEKTLRFRIEYDRCLMLAREQEPLPGVFLCQSKLPAGRLPYVVPPLCQKLGVPVVLLGASKGLERGWGAADVYKAEDMEAFLKVLEDAPQTESVREIDGTIRFMMKRSEWEAFCSYVCGKMPLNEKT